MTYLWIVGELAAIAAICGLVAGSAPDRAKLKRNFLWLALIGAAMALILAVVTHYHSMWVSGLFSPWIFEKQWWDSGDAEYPWLVELDHIPGDLIWTTAAIGISLIWLSGLLAFYCRSVASGWRAALLGVIVGGPLLLMASLFGYFGLYALAVLSQRITYHMPIGEALIALAVLTGLLTLSLILYAFFGKRRGARVLAVQLGIGVGCYLFCWVLALTLAAGYAKYLKYQAVKDGIGACRVLKESLPEIVAGIQKIKDFDKRHPLFELPINSTYDWKSAGKDNTHLVPVAAREYTLGFFNSPEALEYYQWYEDVGGVNVTPEIIDFLQLGYFRALTRVCAGLAALYLETGEPDKIMPQLLKFIRYDREKFAGEPFLINEMVRVACRIIWCSSLVSLGPDGPQYVPYYRQALDYLKEQKMYLPDEAGVALGSLAEIRVGSFVELLTLPSMLASLAKELAYFLSIRPELKKLAVDGYHGEALPWDYLKVYKQLATNSELSLLLGRTGLALKLYRSEVGKYPATLAGLVPKYLDKTPESPFPGHPLVYESDGKDFTLSVKVPSNNYSFEVSSQQRY